VHENFNEVVKVEKYLLILEGNHGVEGLDDQTFSRGKNNHVKQKLE
jgi:hypothetical protein